MQKMSLSGARLFKETIQELGIARNIMIRCTSTNIRATDKADNNDSISPAKPFKQIPGPSFLAFFGPSLRDPDFQRRHDVNMLNFQKQFGDIVKFWLPGLGYVVNTFNVEDIEKVFSNEGQYPSEPAFHVFADYRKKRKDLFPETRGLIGSFDEEWWEFRSKVQQDMMRPKSAMFYLRSLEEISVDLCNSVSLKRNANLEIDDINKYLHYWSLECMGAVFLDARLGCLNENQSENSDANVMIKASGVVMGPDGFMMFQFPFWKYYPFAFYKRFDKASEDIYNISKKYINEAIHKINESAEIQDDAKKSVLTKLIEKCGKGSQIPIVMAMDALFAGIDTTGMVIIFLDV